MKKEKKKKIEGIPFYSAILTALGYLIFFIFWDYFPSIDKIIIFTEAKDTFWGLPEVINLPWKISRLWDIPTIFLITLMFMTLFKYLNMPKHKVEESYAGAIIGMLFGLIIGLFFLIKGGVWTDIRFCFIAGMIINCLMSLIFSIFKGFLAGARFSLLNSIATSLLVGLLTGLKTGFVISFLTILGISLEMIIIVGLFTLVGSSIRYFFSEKFLELIEHILKNELT